MAAIKWESRRLPTGSDRSLPELTKYLRRLPSGLASYKECTSSTAMCEVLINSFPEAVTGDEVPPELRKLSAPFVNFGPWIPDVYFVGLNLMIYDRYFRDEYLFADAMFQWNCALFESKFYRPVMKVLSPTLILLAAETLWPLFHAGAGLTKKGNKSDTTLKLSFPRCLFPHTMLLALQSAFLAVEATCWAEDPYCKLVSETDEEAIFKACWK